MLGPGPVLNGYCVCYDGYIGTKCEITDSTAGTDLNGGVCSDPTKLTQGACVSPAVWNTEVGAASYTDPGGVCSDAQYTTQATCVAPNVWTPFKATAAFKAFNEMQTQHKKTKSATANTMGLAAVTAELHQITTSLKTKGLSTHTKIESELDQIASTVNAQKISRASTVAALHRKLAANAAAIQQDILSSERGKVARLEAHIDAVRSLHAHQTQVQNRLDVSKAAAKANLATKMATVAQHLKENAFTINQVKLMNGPPVKIADLKKSTCTTDQFYGVTCQEEDNSAGFKQNPPGTMDASSVLRG